MKGFGSDNHAAIHPRLLDSILKANVNHAPSYGTDDWSRLAEKTLQRQFGAQAQIYFVFNGTAANVLALKALIQSHHSVLCTDVSHIHVDECGAPEYFTGGKLHPLPSLNGKLQLESLKKAFIRRGDQHFSQTRAVSLTQPTELGTVYSLSEIREICDWAHREGLKVHMDGARICNALTSLNCTLKEMTTDLGVDILSLGGTKNGFLFGEAVVILNPEVGREFKYLRKQAAQLPSKTRFIACQFAEYFSNHLFFEIAQHSCQMAEQLAQKLSEFPEVKIAYPRQSNAVFVQFPREWIKELRETAFFYIWNEETFECRLMCSWDTQLDEIEKFVNKIKSLSRRS